MARIEARRSPSSVITRNVTTATEARKKALGAYRDALVKRENYDRLKQRAIAQDGPLARNAQRRQANEVRGERNYGRASRFSREYIHPGYYAQRARRASGRIGLNDIFAQFSGYLAEPIDFNDSLVRATDVSAMASGTPYDIDRTPPMLRREGTKTPFVMRDLAARINTLLDQFLIDLPERTIDSQSVLFEMLRRGLSTYVDLLRSVTVEARASLRPLRRAYDDYVSAVVDTRRPQIERLRANLAETRRQLRNAKADEQTKILRTKERRITSELNAFLQHGTAPVQLTNGDALARKVGALRLPRGLPQGYRPRKLAMGAKQLAELRNVRQLGYVNTARRLSVRFLETQDRQRRSAVRMADGSLKKWACPEADQDKAFLASGRVACVDARLHSPIMQEYDAARTAARRSRTALLKAAENKKALNPPGVKKPLNPPGDATAGVLDDVYDEQVPLRTVFGDRLVKRNLVLHSFLDTISDELLSLHPNVKMNPTAARLRDAMKVSYHPFHKRFEEAGGNWRQTASNSDEMRQRELKYTEPDVESLAWSSEVGSFGVSGPQPYWLQLVREMYDAQRVHNIRSRLRIEMRRQDSEFFADVRARYNALQDNFDAGEYDKYKVRALRVIERPTKSQSTAMANNLGVTAAGYVMESPLTPDMPWIKSYHRFGRDWYVDDYEAQAKYQLPFGAYREDFYDDLSASSGPRDALLDVYLNQIVTHLTRTDVACRYGHIKTGGVSQMTAAELYKRLERVRGRDGYYAVSSKGKDTATSYGGADGVVPGRPGPTLPWELANGCGMIYGTRDPSYFGSSQSAGTNGGSRARGLFQALMGKSTVEGTTFAPSTPEDWERRSATLFTKDVRALKAMGDQQIKQQEEGVNVRARIDSNSAQARAQAGASRRLRASKRAGMTPTTARLNDLYRDRLSNFGGGYIDSGPLLGRVNQSVITYHFFGRGARQQGELGVQQAMRGIATKQNRWYPPPELAEARKRLMSTDAQLYLTGHDLKFDFLRQRGFGLTKAGTTGGSNRMNSSIVSDNLNKLTSSVVLVDGEIHCVAPGSERIPVRFAGSDRVVSSSGRIGPARIPRRLPLVSSGVDGGADKSRQSREACMAMASLLQNDATTGYDGLKRRLLENLIKPLFDGRMVLRYYHFHDLLMRFNRAVEGKRVDTWSSVLKLMDSAATGDMMDSLLYYILCYTGVPKDKAARRLKVIYAMRRTRQGREALMNVVKDLRLLGNDGPMPKTLFQRIARHLLSTQSSETKGRLTTAKVNTEVAALQKNVNRKDVGRRVAKAVGIYKDVRKNFGMANKMTAGQVLQQRPGVFSLLKRPVSSAGSAALAAQDAASAVFGRRGVIRGLNATRA